MRHRNYRLYWSGFLVSNAGAWIQSVAQGWLVYDISDSAVWLGAIGFIRAFPLIFLSLIGGAVADRFPKRRILYLTQAVQMTSAITLALLTYTGVVEVWHVLITSALSATAQAFDNPARQSMVPKLVPKEDLHAAISLNAIAFNGAALFGPSLTGIIVPWVGLAGCFAINAVTFGAVFAALTKMEFPPHNGPTRKQGMITDVMDGLRFMRTNPIIMALISMAAFTSFFARPYQQFLTVFARDVHLGTEGLAGLMMSATALGTVIFMLSVASLGHIEWKGKLLIGGGIGFLLSLIAFAWTSNIYLAMALLVLVGGFNMTWQTTINTLLQSNTDDEMRGRVMSAYTITALAMMPLGQGPMGVSVDLFGPQWALTIGASVALTWVLYTAFIRVQAVRRLP